MEVRSLSPFPRIAPVTLIFLTVSLSLQAQELLPKWTFETHSAIYGSSASDGQYLYFGNEGGELYCLTREGILNWQLQLDGSIKSAPAVKGKSLIVNTDKGLLYCINAKNGKVIWQQQAGEERRYDLWDYNLSSPVIEEDKVFIGFGDGSIRSFALSSGEEMWRFQTDEVVHASPVILGESLYIGSFNGWLYKLNKVTGQVEWRFDTGGTNSYPNGEIQKAALVTKDMVYVTCRGNLLYEIEAGSGRELRSYTESGSWIIATPTMASGGLVFGTSDSQMIRHISLGDFQPSWSQSVSMRVFGKVEEANDRFLFGTLDGKVYLLDENGSIVSIYQTRESEANYDLVYGENGAIRKDILTLYGTNIAAAETLLLELGGFIADPLIIDDGLYIGNTTGTFYYFDLKK